MVAYFNEYMIEKTSNGTFIVQKGCSLPCFYHDLNRAIKKVVESIIEDHFEKMPVEALESAMSAVDHFKKELGEKKCQ